MTEQITVQDLAELLTILHCSTDEEAVSVLFGIPHERAAALLLDAEKNGVLAREGRGFSLVKQAEIRDIDGLMMSLPVYCFVFLKPQKIESVLPSFEAIIDRLSANRASADAIIDFALQTGNVFFHEHDLDIAAQIYQFCVYYCKDHQLPCSLFKESVLNLSRADFNRGSNPEETANLQKEAVSRIDMTNPSLDDALILLYTGLVQHFVGNEGDGFAMRQQAIGWLDTLSTTSLRHEVVALIGWHIYLSGQFREAIAYYEEMILDIENHQDTVIATMAYPPIIYSYMFLGETQKAMILNELIYRRALEQHDEPTAMMMHCIEGRLYIAANDDANGEGILYDALTECQHKTFIWGQYYAICALCNMHLNRGQIAACHEDLLMLQTLKERYNIGRMYSSPFMLEVLRKLEREGYPAIPNMDYQSELARHIASGNIHLSGVSLRHLAMLRVERHSALSEVLSLLDQSIEFLQRSGSQLELGKSYVEKARLLRKAGDVDGARECATNAWKALGPHTREHFPNELMGLVRVTPLSPDLGTALKTLSLELRYLVNGNALVLRLLTRLSRLLGVESAGGVLYRGRGPELIAAQSVSLQTDSTQYQRMMGWIAYAEQNKHIVSQVSRSADSHSLTANLDSEPAFLLAIPFLHAQTAQGVLYFESSYRNTELTQDELHALSAFMEELTPHLLATYAYEADTENDLARASDEAAASSNMYVGVSGAMQDIAHHIDLVARMNVPVLLTGETGVGKDVFAKELFRKSGCQGAFIKVNCGAIPDSLIESQLFGYERGSFTGAYQTHQGYFELADKGVIFLDEVGELSLSAQVALLRVLQEKEIMRIGGTKTIPVDFRVIAATNKNLREEVERGKFRSDLFFRLNIIPIEIPPLRKRKADIPGLVSFFLSKHEDLVGRKFQVTPETMQKLFLYDWPGNVRELENTIQRAMVFSDGNDLRIDAVRELNPAAAVAAGAVKTLEEVEREYIIQILRRCGGKVAGKDGAAELLGLKRTTLLSRMEKLRISAASYEK